MDAFYRLSCLLFLLLITYSHNSFAQQTINNKPNSDIKQSLHKVYSAAFKNKLYRQALYFYFNGNYAQALNQININNERYHANTAKSDLFGAGLQVTLGLQQQATQALQKIENTEFDDNNKQNKAGTSATSPQELLLVALLQLTEQKIQQGKNLQAQQTLAKITHIPPAYYQQYYVLSQLVYWPESPSQLATVNAVDASTAQPKTTTKAPLNSPYIQLNQALLDIEKHNFSQAESMLLSLKNTHHNKTRLTFWQRLFSPFNDNNQTSQANKTNNQIQQQAITDYAQLLLAQLYVKQQRYNDAFITLKSFPQASPYSRSALFLFAFAAQKTQRHNMAMTLFNLVQQQYPYSNLGWQSALLMASQQRSLEDTTEHKNNLQNSFASYQLSADFFTDKLKELTQFEQQILATPNLLTFATTTTANNNDNGELIDELATPKQYQSNSPWLQKALLDTALKSHYQQLIELQLLTKHLKKQEHKNKWLHYALTLNNTRQSKMIEAQQQQQQPITSKIAHLKALRTQLQKTLTLIEQTDDLQALATAKEQKWLTAINNSERSISLIAKHRDVQRYQKRLQRIKGVLQWQLNQTFIPRLWQAKSQLKNIDEQLNIATNKEQEFTHLANTHQSLASITQRQQKNGDKITQLFKKINTLHHKTSAEIKAKIQIFINEQRDLLNTNLLTARHAMAEILENKSSKTQKTTTAAPQLAPSNVVSEEPK